MVSGWPKYPSLPNLSFSAIQRPFYISGYKKITQWCQSSISKNIQGDQPISSGALSKKTFCKVPPKYPLKYPFGYKIEYLKLRKTSQSHLKGNPSQLYINLNFKIAMYFMCIASPVVIRSASHNMKINYLLNETGESFSILDLHCSTILYTILIHIQPWPLLLRGYLRA